MTAQEEIDIPGDFRLMSRKLTGKEMIECFDWLRSYSDLIHDDLETIGREFDKEIELPSFNSTTFQMVLDVRANPQILTLFKLAWG